MFNVFHSVYSWLQGVEQLSPNETVAFQVNLGTLDVGLLRAENGEWVFSYSNEFRSQSSVNPIVDFPVTNREYRSSVLWPFFALRIPSPKQSVVRDFIQRHPTATVDEGALLKEFGRRSISNPFLLIPVVPVAA